MNFLTKLTERKKNSNLKKPVRNLIIQKQKQTKSCSSIKVFQVQQTKKYTCFAEKAPETNKIKNNLHMNVFIIKIR